MMESGSFVTKSIAFPGFVDMTYGDPIYFPVSTPPNAYVQVETEDELTLI